ADTRGGSAASPERLTVEQYLERWLEHMRPLVSPKSHERYTQRVRVNLIPMIGGAPIAQLSSMQIGTAYAAMIRKGLKPATVLHVHRLLSQALKHAVRWRILSALGHTRVGITLDVYSHVVGNMQDSAARAIDAAFAEANGSKAVAIASFVSKKAP